MYRPRSATQFILDLDDALWTWKWQLRRWLRGIGDIEYTLAETNGVFEIDSLMLMTFVAASFLTFYLGPFWDTFSSLAFKGSFMGIELALGLVLMVTVQVFTKGGFAFRKSVNMRAIAIGMIGGVVLILTEFVVFAFVPPNQKLLSLVPLTTTASGGLSPNAALGFSFYDTAAADESIGIQGGIYSTMVRIFSNYEDDHGWAAVLLAAGTVAFGAFIFHFAAYGETASSLAVAIGFFELCIEYELTDCLISPVVSHVELDTFSTLILGFSVVVV